MQDGDPERERACVKMEIQREIRRDRDMEKLTIIEKGMWRNIKTEKKRDREKRYRQKDRDREKKIKEEETKPWIDGETETRSTDR
jgi:hypothetical protein